MAHTANNTKFHRSLTQRIFMVIVILVGMLFSQFANAQKPEHKIKRNKSKHHIAILSKSSRACYILYKKRTAMPKHPLLSSSKRSKSKPMAETDQPVRLASSN